MSVLVEIENKNLCKGNTELAKNLRAIAADLERNKNKISTVVVLMDDEHGVIHREVFGTRPCDWARLVGLLTMAAQRAALVEE